MSITYTLQVNVDPTEIKVLAAKGYSLYIAKKVNNGYNVVWREFLLSTNNTFQWTEDYAVFAQPKFTSGSPVAPTTNIMPIQSGQVTVLDPNGVFLTPTGNPQNGPFEINNAFVPTCLGVICNTTADGLLPIALDFQPIEAGLESFMPMPTLLVWFGSGLGTSVMFSTPVANSFEIDYTGTTSQSASYVSDPVTGSGIWVIGNSKTSTGFQYTPHKVYSPLSNTFEDLPFASDRTVIRGLLDKYLSSPLGKSAKAAPRFLVQVTITLPSSGNAAEVAAFLKAYLHVEVVANFTVGDDNTSTIGKLAWANLTQMKSLVRGPNEVAQLKVLFTSAINSYGPGYLSVDFETLK